MRSKNEHGVPVTEKAIFPFDCLLVSAKHQITSFLRVWRRERANKRQQSGFREMEIGDQRVDDFEMKRGMHE